MKLTPWMLTVAAFGVIALLAVGFLLKSAILFQFRCYDLHYFIRRGDEDVAVREEVDRIECSDSAH